jgi:glycosyl transferase family 4
MQLLFVHQNFPGQYRHLAAHFAHNREHSVAAIGQARSLTSRENEYGAIRFLPYAMPKLPPVPVHRYLRGMEIATLRAEQVRGVAVTLRREGFIPDIICAHTGWGEALLLKDLFPDTPLLGFFEFYFRTEADIEFDPAFPAREIDAHRVRIKNSVILQSFEQCNWGITPTYWQFTQFPPRCRERISVIFDGIDTNMLTPNSQIRMRVNDAQLTRANEVITFVNRNLEPYRVSIYSCAACRACCASDRERMSSLSEQMGSVTARRRTPERLGVKSCWRKSAMLLITRACIFSGACHTANL